MADQSVTADVLLNQQSIFAARRQRVIQSWLPPKRDQGTTVTIQQQNAEEEDLDDLGDDVGIGSKRSAEDDDGLLEGFKRRKVGEDDRLLEQILGKKGALAKKKAREVKDTPAHAVPKPQKPQRIARNDEGSDEEESGRVAALGSRERTRIVPVPARGIDAEAVDDSNAASISEEDEDANPAKQRAAQPPTTRQKARIYLDELLGQRARKKKAKNKKHKLAEASAQP